MAEEDFSVDLAKGVLKLDENGNPVKVDEKELEKQEKITITPDAEKLINDLLTEAVNNYTIYLQKGADIQDGEEVKEKIERLNEEKAGNQTPQTNTAG